MDVLRERVAEDIYVFTSELYAQVTAGAIFTSEGTVVIDTLPFPKETKEILDFIRRRSHGEIRYLINTHFHGDHIYGSYLFTEADVVAHEICRQILEGSGEKSLEEAKTETPELEEVRLRLPTIVFKEEMAIHLGDKTINLMHMPGHTLDSIVAYVKEDEVLFAGDTVMPVPYIVGGDIREMIRSLKAIEGMSLGTIVQGHGEVLLRGEIEDSIKSSIAYLETIQSKVKEVIEAGLPREELETLDIEKCGKSRIPLNGLVQQLHMANLSALYDELIGSNPP